MAQIKEELLKKANSLPKSPGCYIMKNLRGDIIYIGKAKNLKSRVTTYFNNSKKFIKTQSLVSHIRDFEFILTSNEIESLILENNLIKKHSPKYNIRLKDDKTYPYLQINYNEDFPRLQYTRKPNRKNGYHIYGPFPESFQLKKILQTLTKTFSLRDCSIHEFKSRKTPCLLFEMHQCSAPCVDKISFNQYTQDINKAESFFSSKQNIKKIKTELQDKMQDFSEKENYEKAMVLRDSIFEIETYEKSLSSQEVELHKLGKNIDLIGIYFGENEIDLSIYMIRNSLLIGINNASFINEYQSFKEFTLDLPSILLDYYTEKKDVPDHICLDIDQSLKELIIGSIQKLFDKKIKIALLQKLSKIHQAAIDHAENSQRMRNENYDGIFKALNSLKKILNLDELPRKLECYDVAIFQGSSPTAAQIVFFDGKPDKKQYRYYHLEERPEGNNDFAMMKEVLERRIKSEKLPDIFIVDGGKQQVNTFVKVLEKEKISIPVIGIAKAKVTQQSRFQDKEITKTEERLIIPGRSNPYLLSKNPELFRLIVKMRDEAHRFSRKLHHKSEKKKLIHSDLTRIPGVGPRTAKKILQRINGPIEELVNFSKEDLCAYFRIKPSTAENILQYLKASD